MSEAPILEQLDDDGVLRITLNRPDKKNAFNEAQWDGLRDALIRARQNEQVAVAVVSGAGDDFSAGQDLTAFRKAAEPREDRRADCRRELGVPPEHYYGNHRELLAHRDELGLDAAIVATTVATHCEIVRACVEAGLAIFLEKPITRTLEEAGEVVELVERVGTRVQVGFNLRYTPFFHKLHEIVESGALGTIQAIEITPDQGGLCMCPGGNAFLTLSAGYLGSLVWGIGMIFVALRGVRWATFVMEPPAVALHLWQPPLGIVSHISYVGTELEPFRPDIELPAGYTWERVEANVKSRYRRMKESEYR